MSWFNGSVDLVDGVLKFYDKDKNVIFSVDGVNRKVEFPSGSSLDIDATTTIMSLADGSLARSKLASDEPTRNELREGRACCLGVTSRFRREPEVVVVPPMPLVDVTAVMSVNIVCDLAVVLDVRTRDVDRVEVLDRARRARGVWQGFDAG